MPLNKNQYFKTILIYSQSNQSLNKFYSEKHIHFYKKAKNYDKSHFLEKYYICYQLNL